MLLALRLFIGYFFTAFFGVCLFLMADNITIKACFCISDLILNAEDYYYSADGIPATWILILNNLSGLLLMTILALPSLLYTLMIEKLNRTTNTIIILISGSTFCLLSAFITIFIYISSQQDYLQFGHLILIVSSGIIGLLVSALLRHLYLKAPKHNKIFINPHQK